MKSVKKYKQLIALLAVLFVAILGFTLGVFQGDAAVLIVGLWQLSQFALSKRQAMCFMAGLSLEQVAEFKEIVNDLHCYLPEVKEVNNKITAIEKLYDNMHSEVKKLRKRGAMDSQNGLRKNAAGAWEVSEQCAGHLGSMFVFKAIQDNKLTGAMAETLLQKAAEFMGIETKAAITATDIPLPVNYAAQIVELVYTYGTARKQCTVYPLSGTQMKLPRLKAGEPQFAFIAVSGTVPEKVPQSEWITFTPGKAGGIVRIPSEIDQDSIFSLGQFVARYIAREMAYWEDYCLFYGDGTSTYNSINGVGAQATADSNVLQLATSNTHPSDITLANLRTLRSKVIGSVLNTAMYYMHPTMEALLVSFNTSATVTPYRRNADGTASLDGFPIVWVPIMPVYTTSATVSAYQVAFGDLSWWYFGLSRELDVQTSRDIYFVTDEIGVRALERFDIHAMGLKSTAALQLAAS